MKITKKDFTKYVEVQVYGKWNMLSQDAIAATGLTYEQYLYIIGNYKELTDKYPKVKPEVEKNRKAMLEGKPYKGFVGFDLLDNCQDIYSMFRAARVNC